MLKIIHADLYKTFHRPYLYVLTGVLCGLVILCNFMFPTNEDVGATFHTTLQVLMSLPFLAVMFVDIIMAEEIKYGTLKNTVSSGVFRNSVFIGKSVSSVIIMLISAAVTLAAYLGSAYIRLHAGKACVLNDYLLRIGAAILLVVAAIFIGMFFAVLCRKNSSFAFSYTGFLLFPALIFKGLTYSDHPVVAAVCNYLYKITICGQEYCIQNIPQKRLWIPALVAVAHILIFGIIGLKMFKRQEVN